jgi:hypothetical protein
VRLAAVSTVNNVSVICEASVKERLIFVPDKNVPNIITPNGDNMNDVFRISSSPTRSKLEVYNRWGRKMKEF